MSTRKRVLRINMLALAVVWLLIVAVVYTQMHYAIDSLAAVLLAAAVIGGVLLTESRKVGRSEGRK